MSAVAGILVCISMLLAVIAVMMGPLILALERIADALEERKP